MTTTVVVTNQGPRDVEVRKGNGAVVLRRQAPGDSQSYAIWDGEDVSIIEVAQAIKPRTMATEEHEREMALAAAGPLLAATATAAIAPDPQGEARAVIGASDAPADPLPRAPLSGEGGDFGGAGASGSFAEADTPSTPSDSSSASISDF